MTTPVSSTPLSAWSSFTPTTSTSPNTLNLGGLASGIDTTTIVTELMSIERLPEQKLQLSLSREQARQSALQEVQTQLQSLQTAEQALSSPGLWAATQSVSTSDPSRVQATLTGGAGAGGYQLAVSQLALSWQHTYNYTVPAASDTVTIGGVAVTLAAGTDINGAASAINSAAGSPVYAAVVTDPSSGTQQLVLSARQTGAANNFTLSDPGGSLAEVAGKAVTGLDAQYTVNGGALQTSASNVVSNAIAGVQLTLSGLTTSTGPVTVNVSSPQPSQSAIQTALKAFVDQYNTTLADINSKLQERPVPNAQNATDAAKGVLYGDMGLTSLLGALRNSISASYAPGNPSTLQTLSAIGISTGAAVGNGALNQDAIAGKLSFDTTAFASAIAGNPSAVQALVGGKPSMPGFAQAFDALLAPTSQPGGVLDSRISAEGQAAAEIQTQIADMEVRLQQKQDLLKKQFTAMETAMQSSQAQGQWLQGQITGLTASPTTH